MEFLSALAAGNGAKLIVQITSPEGITPLTLALAVAAKQTRGRFIIIIPQDHHHHHHDDDDDEAMMTIMINSSRSYINELINPDLKDSIEFFVPRNPCEIIKQFKKIDFLVIDSAHQSHHDHGHDDLHNYKLWKNIDVNPKGCLAVVTNLHLEQRGRKKKKKNKNAFRGIIGNRNYETISITVPVGGAGIELLKIRPLLKPGAPPPPARKHTRFHVTYDKFKHSGRVNIVGGRNQGSENGMSCLIS